MKQTITTFTLSAMLLALCLTAEAQQQAKVPKIGYLSPARATSSARFELLLREFRKLGYVEGKNIAFEFRSADNKLDRLPAAADELVSLKVDVLITPGTPTALAAQNATKTIPVVFAAVADPITAGLIDSLARPGGNITGFTEIPEGLAGKRLELLKETDPVSIGVVASLARPGGNVTGLTSFSTDLSGKRLELLKEAVPNLSSVAVLWSPADAGNARNFKETEDAAQSLRLKLLSLGLRTQDDLDNALQSSIKDRAEALIIIRSPAYTTTGKRIVDFAAKNRLPTMFPEKLFVEAGGLMSYAPNIADNFRRAATYVDKILKGAKPADLPVERPMKFEFIINLKTAKQIGLTIPQSLLYRADKVIR
jgi:putative ABC transport system substrate-binding protein